GARFGHYFSSGIGFEFEGFFSRPDFERQNVTITFTDGTTFFGYDSFTEDQLPADFYVAGLGFNLLYRFDLGWARPYVGIGPTVLGLLIHGSGDSCNIVAPEDFATGDWVCEGGEMLSGGVGLGFNAKLGVEIPISD